MKTYNIRPFKFDFNIICGDYLEDNLNAYLKELILAILYKYKTQYNGADSLDDVVEATIFKKNNNININFFNKMDSYILIKFIWSFDLDYYYLNKKQNILYEFDTNIDKIKLKRIKKFLDLEFFPIDYQ